MAILTDEEIKKRDRQKKIAILKASNELLEESKRKVIESTKLNDDDRTARVKDIDKAINENIQKAKVSYGATEEELAAAEYGTVSPSYVEKYERRLKERGLTDEQVHKKEIAVVTASSDSGEGGGRKRRLTRKEKKAMEAMPQGEETPIPLSMEKEIMNATRLDDDVDIDKFVRDRERRINSDLAKGKDSITEAVNDNIESKKVETVQETPKKADETPKKAQKKKKNSDKAYDFDFSSIPANVQFDMIPLPSNGECYPHKKSRIPVAYLTASDENLIASPNMYRDGKILDIILRRKILDPTIKVEELCQGDRDAIILWLRATGYGVEFPIVVTHPVTGSRHEVEIRLDSFKYYDFDLVGDENGHFEYKTAGGDVLKFKMFTEGEQSELREEMRKETVNANAFTILKNTAIIESSINDLIGVDDEIVGDLRGCVKDIRDIVDEIVVEDVTDDEVVAEIITKQMKMQTVSVNGNTDRGFVDSYIDSMRAGESRAYRQFINKNRIGVDFSIKIDLPLSEGGPFTTFLRLDDTVFLNV